MGKIKDSIRASVIVVVASTTAASATPGPAEDQIVDRIRRGEAITNVRTPVEDPNTFGYALALMRALSRLCPQISDLDARRAAAWTGVYYLKYKLAQRPPVFDRRTERIDPLDTGITSSRLARRFIDVSQAMENTATLHATVLAATSGGCGSAALRRLADNLDAYLTLTPPPHPEKSIRTTLQKVTRTSDVSYRCHYDKDPKDPVTEFQDYFDLTQLVLQRLTGSSYLAASNFTYMRKACPAEADPYILTGTIHPKATGTRPERLATVLVEQFIPEYLPHLKLDRESKEALRKEIITFESIEISDQDIEAMARKIRQAKREAEERRGYRAPFESPLENFMLEAALQVRLDAFRASQGRDFGSRWENNEAALREAAKLYLGWRAHIIRIDR